MKLRLRVHGEAVGGVRLLTFDEAIQHDILASAIYRLHPSFERLIGIYLKVKLPESVETSYLGNEQSREDGIDTITLIALYKSTFK